MHTHVQAHMHTHATPTPVESVLQVPQTEAKISKEGGLLEPVVELLAGTKY